jgi:hypothetical protein
MVKLSEMHPEDKELLLAWIYAEKMGLVNNDTRTYTRSFFELMCLMMPQLDPQLPARDKVEAVIIEYLKLHDLEVPSTESVKALSSATWFAQKTLDGELKKGRKIEDIIPFDAVGESDGIN